MKQLLMPKLKKISGKEAIRRFIHFLLISILVISCSNRSSTDNRINSLSEEAKELLGSGDYQDARTKFEEILSIDENNCDGLYGIFLCDTLELINYTGELINTAGTIGLQSSLKPRATNAIDSIAGEMLGNFLEWFKKVDSSASLVESNNCSFTIEKLPIQQFGIEFRGEFDVHEAHLIGLIMDAGESFLEYLLSFDLSVETAPLIEMFSNGTLDLSFNDVVGLLRTAGGIIFATSPDFLKWHPEAQRRANFDVVPQDMASLFKRLNGLLDLFTEQDENPSDDIIAWVDADGDVAVSSGDKLLVNIYNPDTGESLIDLSSYATILLPIIQSQLPLWKSTLQRIEDAFAFRLTPGERISLNDFFLGFGSLIGIPNVFEIDVLAFFKGVDYSGMNVEPLRDFIPFLFDHDSNPSTYPVLLVEGESSGVPPAGTEAYLFQGDVNHFAIGQDWNPSDASIDHLTGEIRNDCVIPQSSGIQIGTDDNGNPIYLPLIYFGFVFPDFNASIYVNAGGSCNDSSIVSKANVYTMNKALNQLIIALANILGGGSPLPF